VVGPDEAGWSVIAVSFTSEGGPRKPAGRLTE
jgi:hypothetical protein